MYSIKQKGMTLIELTVVLLILVALAGLALPYVSGTSRKALCDATDVSMMNIKQVIMQRYYLDTLGNLPKDTKDLTDFADYSLDYLFKKPSEWSPFDLDSQVGWRGPYLQGGMLLGATDVSSLHSSFKSTTFVNKVLANGQTVALDSWGRPFVIQVVSKANCSSNWGITTNELQCARLVSAGSDSGLGLGEGSIATDITAHKSGGDRVRYINVPTPALDINTPCGE